MKKHTLEYYDYFESIQPKLCELMGIEEQYFRDYHQLVGGEYKDFWHVFLEYNQTRIVGNDSFFSIAFEDDDIFEHYEVKQVIKQYGEWCKPLFKAIESLHEIYGTEIWIWLSW